MPREKSVRAHHIRSSVTWSVLDLSRGVVQLDATCGAREVVPVPHLAAVAERLAVDHAAVDNKRDAR